MDAPSATGTRLPQIDAASLTGAYRRPVAFLFQTSDDPQRSHLERRAFLHLLTDQVEFVKGAGRFRIKDLRWAVPLAGATGLTLATDPDASVKLAGSDPKRWNTFNSVSNAGIASLGALAGGTYLWGVATHDPHKRETGVLAVEAATGALIDDEAVKQLFSRDRPDVGTGQGLFFNSPRKFPSNGSFVSSHATISWAIASVIAHEYPGWLTQTAVYGLATLTSAARVPAKKHFPSDVLLGSALGWYIGHQVYRAHHDPELGGMDIGTFSKSDKVPDRTRNLGSTYVPLDSWVYEAIDRLAGMGIVSTNMSSMRPWTRLECARLVQDAESNVLALDADAGGPPGALVRDLKHEFELESEILDGKENRSAAIESLYARVTGISGPPVRDGFHFGQTIYNDFGRPYSEGANFVSGGSAYASSGPWSIYFRGEYQHAPAAGALPPGVQTAIANTDGTLPLPGFQPAQIDRMRVLDAYAALTVRKWQFSFGKQSIWWSPDNDGALNLSNNAEPVNMFRVATVHPLELPGIFRYLGGMNVDAFLGQLEGQQFIRTSKASFGPHIDRQPYLEGAKLGFKPTENFEFGVSITSVWGGDGVPITFRTFRRSFSSGNTLAGLPSDPGDRRTGFDFKYRLPGLRRWLTLYEDSLAEDEPSPIGYPRRSAHAPGLYLSHVPGISKLDLRGEGYFTDLPGLRVGPGSWYFNTHYRSGFTNEGFLLGHPTGRQGRGFTLKSTYWFTPQNTLTARYRHERVNPQLLQGGTIDDYSLQGKWKMRDDLSLESSVQVERWRFPILAAGRQTNVAVGLGMVFHPAWRIGRTK